MPPVFETAAFSAPRLGLGECYEFLQVARRHRGVDRKDVLGAHEGRDRKKLQECLVLRVGMQYRIDDMSGGHQLNRLTIRRGSQQRLARHDIVSARPIVDDDLLPPGLGQLLADEPRRSAGGAPGALGTMKRIGRLG